MLCTYMVCMFALVMALGSAYTHVVKPVAVMDFSHLELKYGRRDKCRGTLHDVRQGCPLNLHLFTVLIATLFCEKADCVRCGTQ